MKQRNKDTYKQKAVDSIISNLQSTNDANLDGDFIQNNDDTGSFQSINTPVCGIEEIGRAHV